MLFGYKLNPRSIYMYIILLLNKWGFFRVNFFKKFRIKIEDAYHAAVAALQSSNPSGVGSLCNTVKLWRVRTVHTATRT